MSDVSAVLRDAPPGVARLIELARGDERASAYPAARDHYQQALALLRSPQQAAIAASLIRWIGDTHRDEGDTEAASDAYLACRAISEATGDRANLAYVLNSLGILKWQWGALDEAADLYGEAQLLATEAGEASLVAMVSQNIGVLCNVRGDLMGALKHYRRSLASYRKTGDLKRMAGAMSNIGMVHTDLGDWDKAVSMFEKSAQLCERVGDLRSLLMVEVNRTELHMLMGEWERASALCDGAFILGQQLDHHLGLGEVHKNYGVIHRQAGQLGMAETHLRKARELGERYASPLLIGEVQRELAAVYRLQDRNGEALQALNRAYQLFSDLQAKSDLADVAQRVADLEAIFLDVVQRWGESIESKDRYTAGHCERVAEYSCALASLMGFDDRTIVWFRMGALLHDVGKTMVPAEILNKSGTLSAREWEVMRRHPAAGVELLSDVHFPWDIRPMIRSHHERWDGKGYPDGIAAEDIPLSARVLCVADVFDALTTNRSYRGAYSREEALEIMQQDSGLIFDPAPLALFRQLVLDGAFRTPSAA